MAFFSLVTIMSSTLLAMLEASNLRIAALETELSKEKATRSALLEQLRKDRKQQVADVIKTEGGLHHVKRELVDAAGEGGTTEPPAPAEPIDDTICSPPSPEDEDRVPSAMSGASERRKRGRPANVLPPGACLNCTKGYGAHAPTCERSRVYRARLL